jgi:predicted house-cleaning noncanonical NTP pyrophosphatase (MazG superfamily)
MTSYNKLIRDKVPQIIKEQGSTPIVETLNSKEYLKALNKKLQEELNEYYEDNSVEELADIVEVIHAILKHKEVPLHKFEAIRKNKAIKRGTFDDKLFLKEVIEP